MSKKYKKITEIEVLNVYNKIESNYITVKYMAKILGTSTYQVQKCYKSLLEKEYLKIDKVGTYFEDYNNGLYTVSNPILFCKVYMLTDRGKEYIRRMII